MEEKKIDNVEEKSAAEEKKVVKEKKAAPKKKSLKKKIKIKVARDKVDAQIDETSAKYAAEMKMPGFRKGTVPAEMIKSRYSAAITEEAINQVLEKAIFDRIKKDKLKVASQPSVDKLSFEDGEDLKADVSFELFPEVELPELKDIAVEIEKKELEQEKYDEEKHVDAVLESNKRKLPVKDREIKEEDVVELSFQSKNLSNKRMTPRKSATFTMKEDSEFELLGIYKELLGKNTGDKVTYEQDYPADFKKVVWAEQKIEHYVDVVRVFEMVKPPMDEAFLSTIGFKDEEAFKKHLKEEFEKYAANAVEEKKTRKIVEKLTEEIKFDVPEGLIEQEIMNVNPQMKQFFDKMDEKGREEYFKLARPEAEKSVRFSLIIDAVQKAQNFEVTNDEIEAELKVISEKNNYPIAEVRKYYSNSQYKEQLKESMARNKAMDYIKETVTVKEV